MRGLGIYVASLLLLTALAWGIFIVRGPVQHKTPLHESMFCCSRFQFSDFLDLSLRVVHFGEPHLLTRMDFTVPYPIQTPTPYPYPVPSVYAFLFFVRLFPSHALAAYLIFVLLSFSIATCIFAFRVRRISSSWLPQVAIWSTLVFGFPLMFLLDRGNIEAVIWVFVLVGLVAYTRNRMLLAAILWAIAASMKIFPGLLFVLFLARRKYGMFATAIVLTGVIVVLALAGIGPTIHLAARDSSQSAPWLIDNYILARNLPQFEHSLFATTKQTIECYLYVSGGGPLQARVAFERALRIYTIVIPLAALLLYWFRLRRLPVLNQFMSYMLLCILLPYVSGDYTLIYGYLVWAAFLLFLLTDVATGRVRIPAGAIYGILFSFAVTFVPLTYLEIHNKAGRPFGFAGQVKTVFLILILVTVLRFPMPSSLFGDLQPAVGSDSKH
jgi:Glycosyltransferase family 87